MRFSVIIPVYNAGRYLRECLDSVLAQTFSDWEAICVDDGSTDDSGFVLDEYASRDNRFRIVHQKNAGVWAARNVALDIAKGDWITFVDADDRIRPRWFEESMQIAEMFHPDLIRQRTTWDHSNEGVTMFEGPAAAEWAWKTLSEFGYLWMCFIRKDVISKLRFRPVINCKEDGIFLMELIPGLRKVCQGSFGGYEYRTFEGSLTKKNRRVEQCVAYLNAYKEIWLTQRDWTKTVGISDLVRRRLRQGADHDVWEWHHQRMMNDSESPAKILDAYVALEKCGALWPGWCHKKVRLRLPLALWRATGSGLGFRMLGWLECVVRKCRRSR